MRYLALTILTLGLFLALGVQSYGEVPLLITHQGRLTTPAGEPVPDGDYPLMFRIYNSEGRPDYLWESGEQAVPVQNGLFTYQLGSNEPLDPRMFASERDLFLEVLVEGNAIVPRTRLTSSPYSIQSYQVEWDGILNMPACFADGIDNVGSGDITGVTAGTGLEGGGSSGDVELGIMTGGVTGESILDGEITDWDINTGAAINPAKIAGTAATLSDDQTFSGVNHFDNTVQLGDSILISDDPVAHAQIFIGHQPLGTVTRGGISICMNGGDTGWGNYCGIRCDYTAAADVIGTLAQATTTESIRLATGVVGRALGGKLASGIYGYAAYADTNWAGRFGGDVLVGGTVYEGTAIARIDHPLDPEGKFLQQAYMQSPEMLSVNNGNVVTDGEGYATVALPEWFTAANRDFRYQLTVIGEFAQAIVAEEISGRHFAIRTDKPNVKVSWQVTGVRDDATSRALDMQVELEKSGDERGLYLDPEAYGQPHELGIGYNEYLKVSGQEQGR